VLSRLPHEILLQDLPNVVALQASIANYECSQNVYSYVSSNANNLIALL